MLGIKALGAECAQSLACRTKAKRETVRGYSLLEAPDVVEEAGELR